MYRVALVKGSRIASVFSIFGFSDSDVISGETKTEKSAAIVTNETGKDRLVKMFQLDEFDTLSPELSSVMQVGFMSMFVGALYGGVMSSRTAYMDFMRNNQATAFKDHLEAKKLLQDKVTLSFGKGAFNWAWRLTLFTTTYVGISTSISVYRGEHGILEHVIAGAATGGIYKLPAGPRGWIVGSALGLVLGTIAGTATYGLLSLTGISMNEVRYWQYHWKETRSKDVNDAIKSQMEQDELLVRHDKIVGNQKGLENIPNDSKSNS